LESYYVLDGTIRFNDPLPDPIFDIKWKGPYFVDAAIEAKRSNYRNEAPPMDPQGVRERLDRQRKSAEARGHPLVAIPSTWRQSTTLIVQIITGVGGLVLIGLAIWKARRA
jgi:hypothetical protein